MLGTIIPFGYMTPGALEGLHRLMADEQVLLIDIRYHPLSRRYSWDRPVLHRVWGERYRWLGKLLGNVNYAQNGPTQLADAERGMSCLTTLLRDGHSLILLCVCADYERCHRRIVVDLIKEQFPDVRVLL